MYWIPALIGQDKATNLRSDSFIILFWSHERTLTQAFHYLCGQKATRKHIQRSNDSKQFYNTFEYHLNTFYWHYGLFYLNDMRYLHSATTEQTVK